MSNLINIQVPDIGDYKNIPVIEIFVKVGDTVAVEDSLLTLESDKATLDVPSSHAGIIKEIKVKVGDKFLKVRWWLYWKPTQQRLHLHRYLHPQSPLPQLPPLYPKPKHPRQQRNPPRPPHLLPKHWPTSHTICPARCWCSVQDQAATRRHFVRQIWAWMWCWWSVTPRLAGCV